MKNNYLWGLLIFIAVLLGAILLGLSSAGYDSMEYANKNTTPTPEQPTTTTSKSAVTTTVKPAPVSGMQTSLGGIFSMRGTYQCDYEAVTPSSRASNTVFFSDGKLRGEFRTISAGLGMSTIIVYDGSYLYTWTEGKATGTVSQPKTLADLPGILPTDVSSGKILGSGLNNVSWNCHAWSKDPSKLVKPSYVTF
jgi:hypothetical protein